jgi:hypothetical protein
MDGILYADTDSIIVVLHGPREQSGRPPLPTWFFTFDVSEDEYDDNPPKQKDCIK